MELFLYFCLIQIYRRNQNSVTSNNCNNQLTLRDHTHTSTYAPRTFSTNNVVVHLIISHFTASLKGTAHLKQQSFWMAIFSSGMKIFKITFRKQDLKTNYCTVFRWKFNHMTLSYRLGENTFFFHFWFKFLNAASDFRFCFDILVTLKTVPVFCDTW